MAKSQNVFFQSNELHVRSGFSLCYSHIFLTAHSLQTNESYQVQEVFSYLLKDSSLIPLLNQDTFTVEETTKLCI